MDSFNQLIAQGNGWLFFPMAVFLGALHGLEPGHSKTMMSAFIIGIRGTVAQAFLLGVSATVSHTAIIWILALVGLHYSAKLNVHELEPYFQLATGVIVIGMAVWMLYRAKKAQREYRAHLLKHAHEHHHGEHKTADHAEFEDAHERAHAKDVQERLKSGKITTGQIILFGLTGGLLPCPSAFAVLLLCLQLKKVALGFALVLGFSVGLAVTLVGVGVIAALSVHHVSKRFKGFGEFARRAPYLSSVMLILVGLLVAIQGVQHLMNR